MIWIFLIIIWVVVTYTHPWIDSFKDFRGTKHILLWYTNFKGERKYVDLTGDQE